MVKKLIQPTLCPQCGGEMYETPATTFDAWVPTNYVQGREYEQRPRETVVAACSGCEFIIDLKRKDGVPKSSRELLREVGAAVREHQS